MEDKFKNNNNNNNIKETENILKEESNLIFENNLNVSIFI